MPIPQTNGPPSHQSPTPPSTHQQSGAPSEGSYSGPRPCNDDVILGLGSPIDDLKKTAAFIDMLWGATLEQSNMQQDDIDCLRAAESDPHLDVTDKHFVKALHIFLSTTNALQASYNAIHSTINECYPNDPFLSFGQMKCHVEQLSSVVPISYDMCLDTCVGFTGPLAGCDHCPMCGKDRYRSGMREPHRQFITIPLGPVIQVLYGSPETANKM